MNAARILTKGRLVFVEGRLRTRSWDDEDTGKRQFRIEIVCDRFQVLGGRLDADRQGDDVEQKDEPDEVEEAGHEVAEPDDDIPF